MIIKKLNFLKICAWQISGKFKKGPKFLAKKLETTIVMAIITANSYAENFDSSFSSPKNFGHQWNGVASPLTMTWRSLAATYVSAKDNPVLNSTVFFPRLPPPPKLHHFSTQTALSLFLSLPLSLECPVHHFLPIFHPFPSTSSIFVVASFHFQRKKM